MGHNHGGESRDQWRLLSSHYRGSELENFASLATASRFYDTEEHLLEDKGTSEVSKQYYLISQFDLLR